MTKLKTVSFKKKVAALTLAAVAAVIPVTSCLFMSNNVHADTYGNLAIGDKIAEFEDKEVVKDTTCVKRWHKYTFTVYYEGTFDNVFVDKIIEPKFVTSKMDYTYSISEILFTSYNLAININEQVSSEFNFGAGINFSGFLGNIGGYANLDIQDKYEYAKTVAATISYTDYKIIQEKFEFSVNGKDNPYNHFYGAMLMMARAHKFRLHVNKRQTAKKRSSALSSWGAYKTEQTWDKDYVFYSSFYNVSANFYILMGDLGVQEDYIKLITNEGK